MYKIEVKVNSSLGQSRQHRLPHYLKVECLYETFPRPKWHKVKKRLPLIYTENFWSASTLPRILLTDAQYKSR